MISFRKKIVLAAALLLMNTVSAHAEAVHDVILQAGDLGLGNGKCRDLGTTGTVMDNGSYRLEWQGDGNFVLYNTQGGPVWNSGTQNNGHLLCFEPQYTGASYFGDIKIMNSAGQQIWNTNTGGRGRTLKLQTDCNLVIYDGGNQPVWNTGTQTDSNTCRSRSQSKGQLSLYNGNPETKWYKVWNAGWTGVLWKGSAGPLVLVDQQAGVDLEPDQSITVQVQNCKKVPPMSDGPGDKYTFKFSDHGWDGTGNASFTIYTPSSDPCMARIK